MNEAAKNGGVAWRPGDHGIVLTGFTSRSSDPAGSEPKTPIDTNKESAKESTALD